MDVCYPLSIESNINSILLLAAIKFNAVLYSIFSFFICQALPVVCVLEVFVSTYTIFFSIPVNGIFAVISQSHLFNSKTLSNIRFSFYVLFSPPFPIAVSQHRSDSPQHSSGSSPSMSHSSSSPAPPSSSPSPQESPKNCSYIYRD